MQFKYKKIYLIDKSFDFIFANTKELSAMCIMENGKVGKRPTRRQGNGQ